MSFYNKKFLQNWKENNWCVVYDNFYSENVFLQHSNLSFVKAVDNTTDNLFMGVISCKNEH